MANYLARIAGRITEVSGLTTSTGATDAGKVIQTDSTGRIDPTLMPVGITPDVLTSTAAGTLSVGDFGYVTSAGAIARASAATSGNDATGFVLSASANGQPATLNFEGRNTGLTGLTVGARYYLSDTTPGGVTSTPVTGTGKTHQFLGYAVSATTIAFEPADGITLA